MTTSLLPNFQFVVADTDDFATQPEISPSRSKTIGVDTIDDLIARNAKLDALKKDFTVAPTDIKLRPEGGFAIQGEGSYTLEEHALRQAGQRMGAPFFGGALAGKDMAAYIDRFPQHYGPIWQELSQGYEDTGNGKRQVITRTWNDSSIRAYMSDRFTSIDNADMLRILKSYLDERNGGNYKLVRPWIGRDGMTVDLIIPNREGNYDFRPQKTNGDDSGYGFGVRIKTGEIGNISPGAMPLVQRHACTNSIVGVDKGITLKQQGNRDNKLLILIGAVGEALQASADLVNRLCQARLMAIPKLAEMVSDIVEKEGFSEAFQLNFSAGTELHSSVWGIVNGLTYAAHTTADLSPERAIEVEEWAGSILYRPNLLNKYAESQR